MKKLYIRSRVHDERGEGMRKIVDDMRLLVKCCSLYYRDNLGQEEICEILGVSRPTVSRLLKLGREKGIVKIEVLDPFAPEFGETERRLEEKFGFREVIVVEDRPSRSESEHISPLLGTTTLAYLDRILKDGDMVGVTLGLTLYNIVHADYTVDKAVQCCFVPVLGGVGETYAELHANRLAEEFARKFRSDFLPFYAPALFSDAGVLQGFKKEPSVRKVFSLFERLDVVLFSIGVPQGDYSTVLRMKYIDEKILKDFSEQGAVGDIGLQYFDINGSPRAFVSHNERVAGMTLADLRKVPRRIAVVAGEDKVKAVVGAVRGGYINTLITDASCARALVNFNEKL